jgi:ABC-type multidrug transport system ATPase subunit
MIEIKNLVFNEEEGYSHGIDLTVKNGEIFFLLGKNEKCLLTLFEILRGFKKIKKDKIFLDAVDISQKSNLPISWVNRIENISDFDVELTLSDFITFICNKNKTYKQRVLETLLIFNLFENRLKNKIKHVSHEDFKAVCLALSLSEDYPNIIFYDFVRGEDKEFEMSFNQLVKEKLGEGKAILYLTQDLFYTCQIADRVSFIKNGYLMPEKPILYEDLKEMDVMKLYKQYLS